MGKIKIGLIILGSIALVGLVVAGIVAAIPNPAERGWAIVEPSGQLVKVPKEASDSSPVIERVIADTTSEEAIQDLQSKGCTVIHRLSDATALECPAGVVPILNVREDRKFYIVDLEADQQINADDVWAQGIDGTGVTVAVLDTGVQADHEELFGSIAGCVSFVPTETTCEDLNGHGTHVAGIITANGIDKNIVGSNDATGVAPGASVYMLKVCNADGICYESDMMAAMEYAVNNSIGKVMSISIGGGNYSGENCDTDTLAVKVNWVVSNGITVAAAAGNDQFFVSSPACASGAIAVGAVDKTGLMASWSNFGPSLDIVAPGVDILSSYSCLAPGAEDCTKTWYALMSGTSMSTPMVSGTAALMLDANSSLTVDEIKTALYSTADPINPDSVCYGVVRQRGAAVWVGVVPCSSDNSGAGIVDAYGAANYYVPTVACSLDAECDDVNPCTADVCENPGAVNAYCSNTAVADGITCDDGKFCTVNDICTAGVCGGVAKDCSDVIACTVDSCDETVDACVNTPNNALCDDGVYCNGAETCSATLGCQAGTSINCNDDNECTTDTCNESLKACENIKVADDTTCTDGVCCSGICQIGITTCPTAVKCWSGTNLYLYRTATADQAKKFCKCAQGSYGYKSYKYNRSTKIVYQYLDTTDDTTWDVTSLSSSGPIYSVTCTDGKAYPTNLDYYYPK